MASRSRLGIKACAGEAINRAAAPPQQARMFHEGGVRKSRRVPYTVVAAALRDIRYECGFDSLR